MVFFHLLLAAAQYPSLLEEKRGNALVISKALLGEQFYGFF